VPPTPQPKRRLKLLAHHFQASALLGSLSGLSHWLLNLQPFAHIVRAGDGTVSPGPLVWLLAIDAALE
jgi:ABC-2 type transport system permease protein